MLFLRYFRLLLEKYNNLFFNDYFLILKERVIEKEYNKALEKTISNLNEIINNDVNF